MRYQMFVAAVFAALMLGACSHKSTVETANGTTVTTDSSDHSVTVQASGETVSVGASIDPSQLGVPVYPGATTAQGGTMTVTGAKGGTLASFTTTDDFDKVYGFYKDHLPAGSEKMKMSAGDGSMAEFQTTATDGSVTTVEIEGKTGKTAIIITHGADK
jgi:hypothetical protein